MVPAPRPGDEAVPVLIQRPPGWCPDEEERDGSRGSRGRQGAGRTLDMVLLAVLLSRAGRVTRSARRRTERRSRSPPRPAPRPPASTRTRRRARPRRPLRLATNLASSGKCTLSLVLPAPTEHQARVAWPARPLLLLLLLLPRPSRSAHARVRGALSLHSLLRLLYVRGS